MEMSLLGSVARFEGGVHEVADGILAWLQPNGGWGESNAALIVGDGESMLIDTLWTPALTRRMLDRFRAHTTVPIRTLVNTHSDGDHVWGNEVLAGTEIVATAPAAAIIRHDPPAALQRMRSAAGLLRRLPVLGDLGTYVSWMLGPYDFSTVRLTPPTREFTGELVLEAGGRSVSLVEVGPAHTAGDLIVHVPDRDVVIAADVMFVGVHPIMWAGPASNWIAALDRILAWSPAAVVPGHGPVCGTAEVELMRAYFEWIDSAAPDALERDRSPRSAAAELARSRAFREAPWSEWEGPERMAITIATIDRHRRGAAGAVGARERAGVFAMVAAVARELARPPFGAP